MYWTVSKFKAFQQNMLESVLAGENNSDPNRARQRWGYQEEVVALDVWKWELWQNAKCMPCLQGSQQTFATRRLEPCKAKFSPFSREARHPDFHMTYMNVLIMLAGEKIKHWDKGNTFKSFTRFIWRAASLELQESKINRKKLIILYYQFFKFVINFYFVIIKIFITFILKT